MMFWVSGAALAVLVSIWLVRPLWRTQRWSGLAVAATVVALAGAGYAWSGSWRQQQILQTQVSDPDIARAAMIHGMVTRLENRLAADPDDLEGWRMLGRSYSVLGRFAQSAEAYARANALSKHTELETLIAEVEARVQATDGVFDAVARQVLVKAEKLRAEDPRVLWFSGLAAEQAGDKAAVRRYWRRLLKQPLPEPARAAIEKRLASLGATPP